MEASKQTRRAIQTGRQITKNNLQNSTSVQEGLLSRPQKAVITPTGAPSLPKLDSDTVNRFRTRPAVAPRAPHPRSTRPAPTPMSEFVTTPTPAQPKPVAQIVQPAPAPAPVPSPAAPTPRSMAGIATRMAVAAPTQDIVAPPSPEVIAKPPVVDEPTPPVIQMPHVETVADKPPAQRQRLPGIDMELPEGDSPERKESLLMRTKRMAFKRWAFRGAVAVVALLVIGTGFLFSQGFLKLNKVFGGGGGTAEALKKQVDPNLLKGEGSGRINVLLLGRGGGTHDAPDLTDTIMLASIDPVNHKTTLISIPRDLWVNVPSAGNMKLNAVYETGVYKYLGKNVNNTTDKKAVAAGFKMVDQSVEDTLGVNIDYNVMVDFKAFAQAVDTVGGVNINVPTDLVDPTMAWENKGDPVLAKAGPQVFDGKHALTYVRSRETSSDFARSQRQRSALMALKTKVDTAGTLSNPMKLSGLMSAFGNNVQTDLSLNNASRLYGIVKKISETNTNSIGFADPPNQFVTTGNVSGQSVVLPKAGLFKYSEMQAYVRSQLKDPYIIKENAKIVVLNGTTTPGVASAKADELRAYGYNVIKAGETPTTGWTQTMLVNLSKNGRNKYTSHYLEKRLAATTTNTLPDNTIPTNGADFVIIIGSDQATP